MNIERMFNNLRDPEKKYLGENPYGRYAAFDYCFNYFQKFKEENRIKELSSEEFIERSCLHLGFYLACWGMFRASGFLLERSLKYYEELIINISNFDERIWYIDVDEYTNENIELLINCYNEIQTSFGKISNKMRYDLDSITSTRITKIMLGVFGNTPALDNNFITGMKIGYTFNKKNLMKIFEFYQNPSHKNIIDKLSDTTNTYDFISGRKTTRKYTKAKIIDMACFQKGWEENQPKSK